jgi:hypothetical protein
MLHTARESTGTRLFYDWQVSGFSVNIGTNVLTLAQLTKPSSLGSLMASSKNGLNQRKILRREGGPRAGFRVCSMNVNSFDICRSNPIDCLLLIAIDTVR